LNDELIKTNSNLENTCFIDGHEPDKNNKLKELKKIDFTAKTNIVLENIFESM